MKPPIGDAWRKIPFGLPPQLYTFPAQWSDDPSEPVLMTGRLSFPDGVDGAAHLLFVRPGWRPIEMIVENLITGAVGAQTTDSVARVSDELRISDDWSLLPTEAVLQLQDFFSPWGLPLAYVLRMHGAYPIYLRQRFSTGQGFLYFIDADGTENRIVGVYQTGVMVKPVEPLGAPAYPREVDDAQNLAEFGVLWDWLLTEGFISSPLPPRSLGGLIPGGTPAGDMPDDAFDPEQLAIGIRVEMEHTNDPRVAKEIAKAHLAERGDYYILLAQMERASSAFDP